MSLPLAGVTVLDLTRVLAGPYATMVLGDLGADVIKVERLPGGDESRAMGPFRDGESYCFAQVNRNKRGVALDLRHPDALKALLALAARSDVVVENFRPGTADRLGCGYDAVRAVRPDVIYCSISGFGQTGPYAGRPAYDIIAQGISGFLSMTGHPGAPPAKSGIALNDIAGGVTAVQAILAAYIARLRGEGGQYIDTSLTESGIAWTVWEAAAYFGSGEVAAPAGTRHRRNAPYQAFRTRDGYVTVGGNTERMWQALCTEVLGRPDWTSRPEYATAQDRLAHGDELERDIESVLVTDTTEHWVSAMLTAGVPAGPVNTYDQMIADPHLTARGITTTVEHPVLGPVRALSSPLRLSKTPPQIRRGAPVFGEHTAQVLGSLGYSAGEVSALQAAGVVYDPAVSPPASPPPPPPASPPRPGRLAAPVPDPDPEARADGDIIFRIDAGAAMLQLNRPAKRNALSQAMWEAICAALAEAAARPDVRAFVFTGLPGVFCAGADLTALKGDDRAAAARYREISLRGYEAVRDFSLPTIAVIDGLCIGGGNNLALACDIRLASPRASFAIPAVRHGIVYDRPTVTRLVELMGSGRASHLLFTAGRIDAARAAEAGLVDIITDDLDAELAGFLEALRAADMPTLLAIRDTIRQVR